MDQRDRHVSEYYVDIAHGGPHLIGQLARAALTDMRVGENECAYDRTQRVSSE
ncbi:unannotated protein [freshwater metagenome]|uniref:Unannotated protein n=1 Tax=freshwater metagenome TaxID=449393 RepID=A0A6J6W285_9ZZZZ